MADAWKPEQYERFQAERAQPFFDLLALVKPSPRMRVVDLGCGTGALTAEMHRRLGARETLGLDSSPAMLAKAAAHGGSGLSFRYGDIADFSERRAYDLVFSNAALHWLPNHPSLFARLAEALDERGQLAVQMPANQTHATHLTAAELASEPSFRDVLAGATPQSGMLPVEEYASLLHRLGFTEQHVRLQVYGHVLPSREDVVEWVKGSLLTDYERRLGPERFGHFLTRYRERLLSRLADERPYFFTFKRILLWARRS